MSNFKKHFPQTIEGRVLKYNSHMFTGRRMIDVNVCSCSATVAMKFDQTIRNCSIM